MMKKTESPIEDIILHDIVDLSINSTPTKNSVTKPSNLKSIPKFPRNCNLTLPKSTNKVFNGIDFITDFEGKFKFLSSSFLSDKNLEESWFADRNVIDGIHPEDLPLAIENLIKIIQENDAFISFNSRTIFGNKTFSYMTWNITCSGQLLFFDISETNFLSTTSNKEESKKDTLENLYFDSIYWKLEVSKTLNAWDKNVLGYLDFCTEIKRK